MRARKRLDIRKLHVHLRLENVAVAAQAIRRGRVRRVRKFVEPRHVPLFKINERNGERHRNYRYGERYDYRSRLGFHKKFLPRHARRLCAFRRAIFLRAHSDPPKGRLQAFLRTPTARIWRRAETLPPLSSGASVKDERRGNERLNRHYRHRKGRRRQVLPRSAGLYVGVVYARIPHARHVARPAPVG